MTQRLPLGRLLALVAAMAMAAPATPQSAPPTFSAETSAVVLDVVVRDKEGHVVRDLSAADFEVFEDGAPQTIDSLQIVSRDAPFSETAAAGVSAASAHGEPDAQEPGATAPAQDAGRPPAVVTLVFDRLSPEALDLAHRAAIAYADSVHRLGDVVGIFTIGHALRAAQEFTSDPAEIHAGIERAAMMAYTEPAVREARAETRERIGDVLRGEAYMRAIQERGDATSQTLGDLATQIEVQRKQVRIDRAEEQLDRHRQGYATTRSLRAIVNGLAQVRGRKTVVLFSEGLAIPAGVDSSFRDVIDAANRGNVSIYTVDAAGLRAESPISEMRHELEVALQQRQGQRLGLGFDGSVLGALQRNEDVMRFAPEATLGPLARETGGFFISDTNDMADRFSEMAEDMHFHYILSYSPTNHAYDGRFRKVSVKVRRKGLDVRSRAGYVARPPSAVAPTMGDPVVRAVAALDREPRPEAFPLAVKALVFPENDRPGLVPVFVSLPCSGIAHGLAPDGRLRGDVTILVRVRDAQRREHAIAHERFRPYAPDPLAGDQVEETLLFSPQALLAPGRYTVEIAAYDAVADQASVHVESLDVPEIEPQQLRLSSLVLAEGTRRAGRGAEEARHPLAFGDVLLQPRLGGTIHKSAAPALGFFFVAYEGQTDVPEEAALEVWSGSQKVEELTLDLEPADALGRVRQAGVLPLDELAPGSYTLRVAVADGDRTAHAQADFTLVE